VKPKTLDHVALWVTDRDAVADVCTSRLGMHVIDRTEKFTLVGSNARRGKLTLFAADEPREPGALKRIGLRVSSGGGETFDVGEGVEVVTVEAPTDVEYDLDHVQLWSADPAATAQAWHRLGFEPAGETRVEVGGAFVEFVRGAPGLPERPQLHHVAVLVDSANDHLEEAKELGIGVDDVVDAPNTFAVFLRGPEGVRVEYVEHKPTFSLT
jgi:catechol 2,3-dioxygenase-like lactoylglutathione lyase family enzyme